MNGKLTGAVKGVLVTVMLCWTVGGAAKVGAEQATGSLGEQIQGSWTLVSLVNEHNGKKTELFGPDPRGLYIMTPDGRFSFILMRSSLPKFSANNRQKGTDKENKAIVQGAMAYFGRYEVTSEQTVDLTIEGSTFPNWDGQVQKRTMTVEGDELRITNPVAASGGTNYIILKRAR